MSSRVFPCPPGVAALAVTPPCDAGTMTDTTQVHVQVLSGRRLRYAVAVLLHEAQHTVTLDDLAHCLLEGGYGTAGDTRKAISDALRWELRRGRAVRIRRGHYRSRGLARSTLSWMRAQIAGEHPEVR